MILLSMHAGHAPHNYAFPQFYKFGSILMTTAVSFLVVDTQLCKRLCLSVGLSVGSLVCWSCSSCHELKTRKRIFIMLQLVLFVCECVGGGLGVLLGRGWGLDAPAHPSVTIF